MSVPVRRLGALAVAIAILGATTASAASAHVGVVTDDATEGAHTVLSFDVPHGCGDSATTDLAIQLPEGVDSVSPTVVPGWEVETVMVELAEPQDDGHGGEVFERVGEVHYRAHDPLPAELRQVFELSVRLPEDAGGDVLAFPTVQTCEQGEAAWIQVAAEGQDPDELTEPAPTIEIVAAGGAGGAEGSAAGPAPEDVGGGAATDDAGTDAAATDPAATDVAAEPDVPAVTYVALVVAVVALVLAGVALTRARSGD